MESKVCRSGELSIEEMVEKLKKVWQVKNHARGYERKGDGEGEQHRTFFLEDNKMVLGL